MSGEILLLEHGAAKLAGGCARRRTARKQVADLEAIGRLVDNCADELLDFNPVLALIARSLHEGIELEVAARRLMAPPSRT